jgi:hypothetical protein
MEFIDLVSDDTVNTADPIISLDSESDSDTINVSLNARNVISLDEDDEFVNVSIGDPELRILSPTEWNDSFISRDRINRHFSRPSRRHGSLLCYSPRGTSLAVGMCVELDDRDFLFIEKILPKRTFSGPCRLRGILLRRNSSLNRLHPTYANEVSAFLEITNSEQHPSMYGSLVIRTALDVKAMRELIFTNAKFPEYRSPKGDYSDLGHFRKEARLICRSKHIQHRTDERENAKILGEAIINLTEDDVESVNGRKVSDVEQMVKWTSSIGSEPNSSQPRAHGEEYRYSFGDAFCGGGGATRAADQLGMRISFGFVSVVIVLLVSLFARQLIEDRIMMK